MDSMSASLFDSPIGGDSSTDEAILQKIKKLLTDNWRSHAAAPRQFLCNPNATFYPSSFPSFLSSQAQ